MSNQKHYAHRDIEALDKQGNYYSRHVEAMTAEALHSKSDIAAELAWRDREIDELRARLRGANLLASLPPEEAAMVLADLSADVVAEVIAAERAHWAKRLKDARADASWSNAPTTQAEHDAGGALEALDRLEQRLTGKVPR